MIKNYFLVAWRTLLKNRLFSFINIISLALSISLCMIVMIHVLDTFRYDNFHPGKERIYRITSEIKANNGNEWTLASSPLPLKEVLEQEGELFAEVVSLYRSINHTLTDGVREIPVRGVFTQPSFFKVFGFSLAHGDAITALSKPNTVILSAATAKKFFASEDPIGEVLTIQDLGTFEVTGIMNEAPSKSHIDFDIYVSDETVSSLEADRKLPNKQQSWDSFELGYTYVKLADNVKPSQLDERLKIITKDINKGSHSGTFTLIAQALKNITPGTDRVYNDIGRGSTWGKLLAEIGVAFIILVAACFNYTNLSIARSLTRMKEVGIRRVAGAKRSQIFIQYIVESVVVACFALALAEAILGIIIEYDLFNNGYEFVPDVKFDVTLITCFIAFALFVGVLAGVLPATLLSSLKTVKLLRNFAAEKLMAGLTLRKVLLVFQFSLSLIIIIFLVVFDRQFEFMAKADPGYRMDNIVTIPVSATGSSNFSTALSMMSGVELIGKSSGSFGKYVTGAVSVSQTRGDAQPFRMDFYYVDAGMIELSGLTMVAGKNYADRPAADEKEIIINEKALTALGFKTSFDAVGQVVYIEDTIQVMIAGVVKDFYNQGVGNAVRPLMLRQKDGKHSLLNVLISEKADRRKIEKDIAAAWKKVYPDKAFTFQWLREEHDRVHAEMGSVSVLGFLAFMTIVIACLGLLGLIVYTVETRRKEISIRKIIGASVYHLTYLLSSGFAKLLLLAGCIALPVGYGLSELFLMNFANKVTVGAAVLLSSFAFLLVIGLLMIGSQTLKAAFDNPVKYLRNE